jgi:hypothetical protein
MEKIDILNESLTHLEQNNFDDSLIKDNKLPFIVEEKMYRVRMPNQGEQSLTEHQKNLAQLEYLKQPGCITKNQLIAQLKETGVVDIQKLEDEREVLTKELKKYWFLLATKDSSDKNKISEYSTKILKFQEMLKNLSMDISTFLSPSLESRLESFYVKYLAYLCTEKLDNGNWVKVWELFEDFNKDDKLGNQAIASTTWLLLNRR